MEDKDNNYNLYPSYGYKPPVTAFPDNIPSRKLSTRSMASGVSKSKNNPRQRRFNLTEVIDSIFEYLVNEYVNDKALEVPIRFYEFYNSQLMRSFLISTISYFHSYIKVMETVSNEQQTEFNKARKQQLVRLRSFGENYAVVLLHCSLYEQTKDDEIFFECLYHFTFLVLKQSLANTCYRQSLFWNRIEKELSYLFRGLSSKFESDHGHKNVTNEEKLRNKYGLPQINGDIDMEVENNKQIDMNGHTNIDSAETGKGLRAHGPTTETGANISSNNIPSATEVPLPDNNIVGAKSLLNDCQLLESANDLIFDKSKIQPNKAMKSVDSKKESLNTNSSIFKNKWFKETEFSPSAPSNSNNVSPGSLKARGSSPRKKKFSVHAAINARSPLIRFLFPTPRENLENSPQYQRLYKQRLAS